MHAYRLAQRGKPQPMGFGTLYGIGVGPGDPDLMTVKSLKIIEQVAHVFAASSPKNDYSVAENIVAHHFPGMKVDKLPFPMTKDKDILKEAWEENARRVLAILRTGDDAAFITIGDPSTYSTFTYLQRTVRELDGSVGVATVPGITSYQAAAAAANTPLAEGEESFHLISGALGADNLRKIIETSENVAILKTYKHFDAIRSALDDLGLLDRAMCVSKCGLDGETVITDLASHTAETMPYLSLVIVKKRGLESRSVTLPMCLQALP